ncbi:MAG TPA: hypothetical protein VNT52_09390, partial [Acidimicrobiales bacterium]|nr:hypothetical protein [Acidimicrobiales bacterium]
MLAALSAAAAVFSPGSATGWALLDALLLASLGGATVVAGFHAPSALILVASVACAVAGFDSVALPLALAATAAVWPVPPGLVSRRAAWATRPAAAASTRGSDVATR